VVAARPLDYDGRYGPSEAPLAASFIEPYAGVGAGK
jgi:hypothetical protein